MLRRNLKGRVGGAVAKVRPQMRIIVGPNKPVYDSPVKHDDVIIVPEFFCKEDDWQLYYDLIKKAASHSSAPPTAAAG